MPRTASPVPDSGRIAKRFAALKEEGRGGFVAFVTAGDPDFETSMAIVKGLPGAGADVIELGMPFTDPMADGPAVQAAGLRALRNGQTMKKTLALARALRDTDEDTPVVLMGYYNPIYIYGVDLFLADARAAGVDGLIIVDLPPEEDGELCIPALEAGVNFIRLATPTTDDARLPTVLNNASGFVYYVSVTGITGTKTAAADAVSTAVARIKRHTDLPVAVGFGVKTAEAVREIVATADAAVVGSAIVEKIRLGQEAGLAGDALVQSVLACVAELARGCTRRSGRAGPGQRGVIA